ncbi:MAG: hypothetical protein K2Y39_23930 [Candidatus Obscuribacterales bacterium]|nr:hypothetical protein [Candidatus Obscuribacterales bacterium]
MLSVIDAANSPSRDIGLKFRSPRSGPELELVDTLVKRTHVEEAQNYQVTIFREPKIAGGFPDLVIVIWDSLVADSWNSARAELDSNDFKLMHYLSVDRPVSKEHLRTLPFKSLDRSLDKLERAEMVEQVFDEWIARPYSCTFAAKHIVAVEAKMSNAWAALEQATKNIWFASCSCVVMPKLPRDEELMHRAASIGVSFFAESDGGFFDHHPLVCDEDFAPLSYVSWLFNDWAWRLHQKA